MDLTFAPEQEAFRDELRSWLAANHPGDGPAEDTEEAFAFRRAWGKKLHEAGWAGIWWPQEYGGRGASLMEAAIFNEEVARSRVPDEANVIGVLMGGPTVMVHGTPEQKERLLPPILSTEEIWCQGFSEPESGSDLAGVKTRARLGVSQRALDLSVAYAKDRSQFGRPIGAYQAVAHRLALMLRKVEAIRSTVYWSAWASDAGAEARTIAAAMAKAEASQGGLDVTRSAIQVHGGIGFTWEHDCHLLLKRAHLSGELAGSATEHYDRVARLTAARVAV